ncbi:hypothetical protein [Devosia psychrophila]|jgi:hypothetical protein|nr:hypothetical protein [Devosia psychrophila]SFD23466.1 hypothetical protein SAMN04488059_13115 [Devosia psychrophila]
MSKARISNTHRTPLNARIVFNDGQTIVSCSVHQLTESGATLQVHSVLGIPSTFRLALSDTTQHPCWVVRKAAKEIKVAFTDWQPAAEAMGA